MKIIGLLVTVLLTITSYTTYTSYSIQQASPLLVMLNGDVFSPNANVIISGQAQPMETIKIQIQSQNQTNIYRLIAESDRDGHFKVDLEHSEPLLLGRYLVKAIAKGSIAQSEFTVQDESFQLYKELEQIVGKTRSEAIAVYKMLDPSSALATNMSINILDGNSYYLKALKLHDEGQITDAMDTCRMALQSYGEALHFKEQLCSSKPTSSDTMLIIELLEKIRRLNDTTVDLNKQPSISWGPLQLADDLLTQAEKQLSDGDLTGLHYTLQKLREAMEDANKQTQMISASMTLSRIYSNYQETYTRVEQLENNLTIKTSQLQLEHIEVSDDIEKIKGLFYLMPWIQAASVGKPYNSTEPTQPKVDERYTTLNASIVEAEEKLSGLVEGKSDAETLTKIYNAWDLLKDANLTLLGGDVTRAEELYREAAVIMDTLE